MPFKNVVLKQDGTLETTTTMFESVPPATEVMQNPYTTAVRLPPNVWPPATSRFFVSIHWSISWIEVLCLIDWTVYLNIKLSQPEHCILERLLCGSISPLSFSLMYEERVDFSQPT